MGRFQRIIISIINCLFSLMLIGLRKRAMPRNRRSSNRFDVHIVGEFQSLSMPAMSFLGITRDFSCGGFSIESQCSELAPGDNLAFTFKHPERDVVVSTEGEIVWKQTADKFICLMGIKFRDISESVKSGILKILSAAGDVPVDFFLSYADTGADPKSEIVLAEETGQEHKHDAAYTETDRGNKKNVSTIIAVTAAIVLSFSLPAPLDDMSKGVSTPELESVTSISGQDDEENPLLSLADNSPLHGLVQGPAYKSSPHTDVAVLVKDEAAQPGLTPTDSAGPDTTGFYIQVGSWKNPDYAHETRDQLIEFYPDAYIVVEKGFHVIRIPGIMTKTEGNGIIKDIESKYKLTPLLFLTRK